MTKSKQHDLEAKQEALEAWSKLPQGTPSREALPPAGGGLIWFFGLFMHIREHKVLSGILFVLAVVVIVFLLVK